LIIRKKSINIYLYEIIPLIFEHIFILSGHKESVLSVDSAEWSDSQLIVTGSKDNSLILWRMIGFNGPSIVKLEEKEGNEEQCESGQV
jgi:WD40 repeat protein